MKPLVALILFLVVYSTASEMDYQDTVQAAERNMGYIVQHYTNGRALHAKEAKYGLGR
jgi:Skp family chaperone for outer membrane proteins